MRLLGYIRVSTEEQADHGSSVSVQDLALHRYAELYQHDLIDVHVELGVSGGIEFERRPEGRRVMDRLADGEADGVLITALDRMFRLTLDGLQMFAHFDRRGWAVHSVYDRIDTSTAAGKYDLTMALARAEFERNRTSERTRQVLAGMRQQGRVYSPNIPYGCTSHDGKLYRDPATLPSREYIVALRNGGLSLRAICAEMKARGLRAPSGGLVWHVSTLIGIIESHEQLQHIPELPVAAETAVSAGRVVQ